MKIFDHIFENAIRLGFLALFVVCAVIATSLRSEQARIDDLRAGQIDAPAYAAKVLSSDKTHAPQELIVLAEQLNPDTQEDHHQAIALLERALQTNHRLPIAHAKLVSLETEPSGRPNEAAIEHLEASFWDCPYCNRDLLRWRLAYVIKHWNDIPEEIRLQAFAGADVLRWWYLDYEFLEQISREAVAKGIAFNAYQRKIYTPVRPSEIGQD
ncbi:MAG: hypothetical protein QNI84_01030 [Henriciella sp.]|nr:hypothetical protein [Henriciella sp.]